MNQAQARQAIGSKLGEYIILDVIGAGGMGVVYRARHAFMNRIVALKTLHPQAVNQGALERFEREVKLAAKVSHENIVTSYDAGVQGGVHYLVMEFIDGTDLASLVKKNGPLPFAKALDYTLQTAEGLRYAHEIGLVHRDIKPHNLLLDRSGTIKILDLGLARLNSSIGSLSDQAAERSADLTRTGTVLGTFHFMAPEQARNTKLADQRADIYSLGCTFHYLLAGKPLFTGETLMEIFLAHQQDPVPSLQALNRDVPTGIDKTWQKMVAKEPEKRQQSIAEVIRELRGASSPGPQAIARKPLAPAARPASPAATSRTEAMPVATAVPSPSAPAGLSRRWLAGGIAALLLLVVLVIFFSVGGRNDAEPPVPAVDGLTETYVNHLNMRLKRLPAGTFQMGSSQADLERLNRELRRTGWREEFAADLAREAPAREVRIDRPFQMGTTEVTIGQFQAFADATGYQTDAQRFGTGWGMVQGRGWTRGPVYSFRNLGTFQSGPDLPAVSISWNDAVAFCDWLTREEQRRSGDRRVRYRLPTEAEWEYACRAGSRSLWGVTDRDNDLATFAWYGPNGGGVMHDVGTRQANAWGLFDMLGNEREWCLDRHGPEPAGNPREPGSPEQRVQRGGSFGESAWWTRPACRFFAHPTSTGHGAFRVARVLEE